MLLRTNACISGSSIRRTGAFALTRSKQVASAARPRLLALVSLEPPTRLARHAYWSFVSTMIDVAFLRCPRGIEQLACPSRALSLIKRCGRLRPGLPPRPHMSALCMPRCFSGARVPKRLSIVVAADLPHPRVVYVILGTSTLGVAARHRTLAQSTARFVSHSDIFVTNEMVLNYYMCACR